MNVFYTNVAFNNNNIYVKGYNKGEHFIKKVEYKPYIFVESANKGDYRSFNGSRMEKKVFDNVSSMRTFVENTVKKFSGFGVGHSSVKEYELVYPFISDVWKNDIKYDLNKIKILDFDIETTSHSGFPDVDNPIEEILSIACSVKFEEKRQYVVFGLKEYFGNGDFEYIHCIDEKTLLKRFLDFVEKTCPDVITGWNTSLFDIPYLCSRVETVYKSAWLKKLSPFKIQPKKGITKKKYSAGADEKEFTVYRIKGVSHLDYIELYKKFTYVNRESYKLDHIAYIELGENKLDYSEYGNLNNLYQQNWDVFIDYNYHDVRLVDGLVDKLKLIELCATIAYITKTNYNDSFSPIKSWESHIYNYLIKQNIVIPLRENKEKHESNVGGRVKKPKIGFSEWVVTLDVNSEYPNCIRSINISPDTKVGRIPCTPELLLDKKIDMSDIDHSIAGNGSLFRRDKEGFMTKLVGDGFSLRKKYKNMLAELKKTGGSLDKIKEYDIFQHALKIFINSGYGIYGNPYFIFYDLEIASAITNSGQAVIQVAERAVNEYLNKYFDTTGVDYVVFSDTDSIAVELKDLFNKFDVPDSEKTDFIIKFHDEHLAPLVEQAVVEFSKYCNFYQNTIVFGREKVADVVLIVAKKNYIVRVLDDEGVRCDPPKLVFKGITIVRSSTPEVVKEPLRKSINFIIDKNQDGLHKHVEEFKDKYFKMGAEEIAIPSGVSDLEKYTSHNGFYIKGTQAHTKSAILYNKYLDVFNISSNYEQIKSGGKVKYVYLRLPNKIRDDVIGYSEKLPKEFGIDKNIDYIRMYKTTFLKPLTGIVEKIGWTTEAVHTLGI